MTEVEEEFVLDALRSGWVAPLGPHVDAFESEVAQRVGAGGALALASGTAALHLALLAVGAGPGTVVIVPSLTFVATANTVCYTGAQPVFVDCLTCDGNIDPELLLTAVDRLRAEGIVVAAAIIVDLFGRCADYDRISPALEARGIPIVEDAAESFGATFQGRAAGSFGQIATLSFNGNKIMTTSGGGMLLSDDLELVERCRYLSMQARRPVPWLEHTEIGYNYRMSNLLAALGRGQLTRLDAMIARRRQIHRLYEDGLAGVPGIRFLSASSQRGAAEDTAWLTVITVDQARTGPASTLVATLARHRIETRQVWKPMHLQPVFRNSRAFVNGNSEKLFECGVALPSGAGLSDDDIHRVIDHVTQAIV